MCITVVVFVVVVVAVPPYDVGVFICSYGVCVVVSVVVVVVVVIVLLCGIDGVVLDVIYVVLLFI